MKLPHSPPPEYWFVLAIMTFSITIIILLALPCRSHAECFHDRAQAQIMHPGVKVLMTTHLAGHEGERCWHARGWRDRDETTAGPEPAAQAEATQPQAEAEPTNPVVAAHAAFPEKPLSFETWSFSDRLLSAGWRLWLRDAGERLRIAIAHAEPSPRWPADGI